MSVTESLCCKTAECAYVAVCNVNVSDSYRERCQQFSQKNVMPWVFICDSFSFCCFKSS